MRGPLVLVFLALVVAGITGANAASPPSSSDDGPNPRHLSASSWPTGTMLYVDFQLGTFTRSPVPNQGYHLSYIVRTRRDSLSVYIPGEVFGSYQEVQMDELKLLREAGVFKLMGRMGSRYYWFEGSLPREIPRARWAGQKNLAPRKKVVAKPLKPAIKPLAAPVKKGPHHTSSSATPKGDTKKPPSPLNKRIQSAQALAQ